MIITLTPGEWQAAASIGERRQALRVTRGRDEPEYRDGGGTHVKRNQIGAVAEYALAKALGVLADWCDTKSFSLNHKAIPCDVGLNIHVRATDYRTGRLVLHPYDPTGGVFVLAVTSVKNHTVDFRGWDYAYNIKVPEYWDDYSNGFRNRPAYCVPQGMLNAMEDLPQESIK